MDLGISLEYCSNGESVTCHTIPDYLMFRHRGGSLGSWFTEIINMDYSQISLIVDEYFSDCDIAIKERCLDDIFMEYQTDLFTPPNREEVYSKLIKAAPVIGCFYHYDDWFNIVYDFYSDGGDSCCNACSEVEEFKLFLHGLIDRPELVSYEFLEFLNRHDAIPPVTVAAPSLEYRDSAKLEIPNSGMSLDQFLGLAHQKFMSSQNENYVKEYVYSTNQFSRFSAVLVSSLLELARYGKVVKKCSNCGKYFIPKNRSDTLYCDAASPQDPALTCMQYGSQRLWYERQKEDELATLSRKIASAKGMLAKRNPDIPAYAASYEYFKAERMIWKKAVDEGRKTKEEYREWLLLMQSQKVIKEAVSNPG